MTRFILVGGRLNKASDDGKAFYESLVAGIDEPIAILDCLFARPRDTWEEAFVSDQESFRKNLPGVDLSFELAEIETFTEQVQHANSIFVRGGNDRVLIDILSSIDGWPSELSDKTFAGSSAGADMLSKHYYNLDTLQLEDGLGLVPVKMIPHWKSDYNSPNIDWDRSKEMLEAYGGEYPVLTLAEGEFSIFEL